jgi:hypothetical protein
LQWYGKQQLQTTPVNLCPRLQYCSHQLTRASIRCINAGLTKQVFVHTGSLAATS